MKIFRTIQQISLAIALTLTLGCAFQYRAGQELEEKGRLEEAAIAYQSAFVEDPGNEEILEALQRTNKKVAEENLQRYQAYLDKRQFQKAYRRLNAAAIQNPASTKVQSEQSHWHKILIAGKISFQFDRLQANIRLADAMQLQILVKSPSGQILTADISNETGLFFMEDLLYQIDLEKIPLYSIYAVGLKLERITDNQETEQEFQNFVNFRGLLFEGGTGRLRIQSEVPVHAVVSHRMQLIDSQSSTIHPWFPPRLIRYSLLLQDDKIQVITEERIEFMPDVLYLNNARQRAFVDFGVYQLTLNPQSQVWSISKVPYQIPAEDYFHQFSKNLALSPYFSYREGAYRYLKK